MSREEKQRIKEQEEKMRRDALRNAKEKFKNLKDLLASKGYNIHRHHFSYTVRSTRQVGIEPPKKERKKWNKSDKVLSIPYMRTLFTLAHEVGHVLQWDEETNKKHNFDTFYNEVVKMNNNGPEQIEDLKHIHNLWYELDAWITGMQFIPTEYMSQYKKYAYSAYITYMRKHPSYYANNMLLRNFLFKLNAHEQF